MWKSQVQIFFPFLSQMKKVDSKNGRAQIRLQNVEQNTFQRIAESIFILSFNSHAK